MDHDDGYANRWIDQFMDSFSLRRTLRGCVQCVNPPQTTEAGAIPPVGKGVDSYRGRYTVSTRAASCTLLTQLVPNPSPHLWTNYAFSCKRWVRVRTMEAKFGSSSISFLILSHACMTVVWSRPPNSSPMRGNDASVSSRARYMAICRG